MEKMKYNFTEIKFKSKTKKSIAKAASYNGTLYLKNTDKSIIIDYYIIFKEVEIDLKTTPSWFQKKTNSFRLREELFSYLGLPKQQIRNEQTEHNLRKLDKKELEKFNEFINSKARYKTTIKNLVGVIKGSNPSGEIKKPEASQIIIDSEDSKYRNFVLLVDVLIERNNIKDGAKDEYLAKILNNIEAWKSFKKRDINEFFNNISLLRTIMNSLQESQNEEQKQEIYNEISSYIENNSWKRKWIDKKISQKRREYTKNVKEKDMFYGTKKINYEERCHILNVSWIKEMIQNEAAELSTVEDCKRNRKIKELLEDISNEHNYLNLPATEHTWFDTYIFTYSKDGKITLLKRGISIEDINTKYREIDPNKLTDKTKQYIEQRNKYLDIEIKFISET